MKKQMIALLFILPAAIQVLPGADYRLDDPSLNAGGRPAQSMVPSSASYRVSLESIGQAVMAHALTGASFRLQGGFISTYRPPGEVSGLQFLVDHQTLNWLGEPGSTGYNVYSGSISSLPGGYGLCAAWQVAGISWSDPAAPALDSGRFYLVTGVNPLWEEGTKGYASSGVIRANPAACP